jgi:hypothetical protein
MLRSSDRFAVGVPQVPLLARLDHAADELASDVLAEPARRSSSATHLAGGDDGAKDLTRAAMLGPCVPGVDGLPGEVAASLRAEPGVHGERLELTSAEVAATSAERDASVGAGGAATCSARVAEGRVAVA